MFKEIALATDAQLVQNQMLDKGAAAQLNAHLGLDDSKTLVNVHLMLVDQDNGYTEMDLIKDNANNAQTTRLPISTNNHALAHSAQETIWLLTQMDNAMIAKQVPLYHQIEDNATMINAHHILDVK